MEQFLLPLGRPRWVVCDTPDGVCGESVGGKDSTKRSQDLKVSRRAGSADEVGLDVGLICLS